MSKRLLALLFLGTISLAGMVLAQDPPAKEEPPVRLKKKKPRGEDKSMVDPDKPAQTKKDDKAGDKKKEEKAEPREPEPVTPQEEASEVLHRVVSNVHKVDERLAKGDLGEATQQTQRDILKDLESLIRRNENPPPQGGGGQADQNKDQGGGDDQNNQNQQAGNDQNHQNQQGGGQGDGQKNQKQSRGQKSPSGGGGQNGGAGQQNQRMPGGGTKSGTKPGAGSQSGKQQRAEGKQSDSKPGGNLRAGMEGKTGQKPGGKDGKNGNGGGGGNKGDRALNKNADLDKEVWGHVPQTLRPQMDAYSKPQPFMPKYDDLIKRYYQTIAEQGRRKGE